MIYFFFALVPLWSIVQAFRQGYFETVFFGRYSRAEKTADFWFFITGATVMMAGATIAGLHTLNA